MLSALRGFWQDEDGVETIEYALLLALFITAGIAVLNGLSCKTITTVYRAARAFDTASGNGQSPHW